jgi:hypothetical protein
MPAKADQNRAIRGRSAFVLIHRRWPGARFRFRATISAYERAALRSANDNLTTLNNVLTGRPARVFINRIVRVVGPLAAGAPSFPLGGARTAEQPARPIGRSCRHCHIRFFSIPITTFEGSM